MTRSFARIVVACLALALATNPASTYAQVRCDTSNVRRPSFAIAGFNVDEEGVRRLRGNAFIVYAQPTLIYCDNANPPSVCGDASRDETRARMRVWRTIVVSARHVVREVCARDVVQNGPPARLTLLPSFPNVTTIERSRYPVEVTVNEAWCAALARANPGLVRDETRNTPDIVVFEQEFALPIRAIIRPFTVGYRDPDGHENSVVIAGFVPRAMYTQASATTPSNSFVGAYANGLLDRIANANVANTVTRGNYWQLEGAFVYGGMSGSPVVSRDNPGLVYGVLTNRGDPSNCSQAVEQAGVARRLASARGSSVSASAPPMLSEEEEDNYCNNTAQVGAEQSQQYQTAYMLPILNFSYLYRPLTSLQTENARIDAALALYEEYLIAMRSEYQTDDQRMVTAQFTAAVTELTALEQVRFWSRAYEWLQQSGGGAPPPGVARLENVCVGNSSMIPNQ